MTKLLNLSIFNGPPYLLVVVEARSNSSASHYHHFSDQMKKKLALLPFSLFTSFPQRLFPPYLSLLFISCSRVTQKQQQSLFTTTKALKISLICVQLLSFEDFDDHPLELELSFNARFDLWQKLLLSSASKGQKSLEKGFLRIPLPQPRLPERPREDRGKK